VGALLASSALGYKLLPRWYNAHKLAKLQGRDVYDENSNVDAELSGATSRAKVSHRRVLVVLGGDWCQWCLALDDLLHSDPALSQLLATKFVTLKLDADTASDLNDKWGNPTEKGVPAIVVLGEDGRVLHTQNMLPFETWGGRLLSYDGDAVYSMLLRYAQ